MSARVEKALIIASVALVLLVTNFLIFSKERIIRTGKTIYLELAPVDPGALMQGDYMALRFSLAGAIAASQSDTHAHRRKNGQFATLANPTLSVPDSIRFRWRDARYGSVPMPSFLKKARHNVLKSHATGNSSSTQAAARRCSLRLPMPSSTRFSLFRN
jgi:GDYXXLXY protein